MHQVNDKQNIVQCVSMQSTSQESQPVRASLDHLRDVGDIEDLSVRQLKEILATNFVDYKGCCEKWELMDRVKRLWTADQNNRLIGKASVGPENGKGCNKGRH